MKNQGPKELDYFRREHAQYFAYYRVPKLLFTHEYYRELSTEAKVLYGILLDRMQLSLRNQWYDEEGRVYIYCTIREIMEKLGCGNQKAVSLLKELDAEQGIGLVEKKRQGMGKPNALYIKNFASILSDDGKDIFLCRKKCENHTSGDVNITFQEMWNSHGNNTDKNNTEGSETDPSYLRRFDQSMTAPDYMSLIKENVDYHILIHDYPNDREMIDELVGLAADTMSIPDQASVRISGIERPAAVVRSRFMKLNMFHIQYILDCLKNNTRKVGNIKNYLLAALYNAPLTIENYYRARVQHDMFGGSPVDEEDRHGIPP